MLKEAKPEVILDRDTAELSACACQASLPAPFIELSNTLPSDVERVSPFVDQLMPFIARYRGRDEANIEIEMALREALTNAIVHDNQKDPERRVYLWCRCTTNGEVSITVRDEGRGFNSETVPDSTAAENLFRPTGCGIYLIRTLMAEVRFEQRGTVLHMHQKGKAASGPEGEAR